METQLDHMTPSLRMTPALALCAASALLCSCASTSVQKAAKSPEFQGPAFKKAAVLVVDERTILRRALENRLATQIQQGGATAITTVDLLALPEIQRDKPAAAERLRGQGAEAIVILRLADVTTSYRESRPGHDRFAGTITGYEWGPWYDYYSVAYVDMSPTYGNLKQKVYLETGVFDLKTAKRLWGGLTQTVLTDNMDRAAEMDPLVAKIVEGMRKDGIFP